MLNALVQFDEEVGFAAFDSAADVDLVAQSLQLGSIDSAFGQDRLFDFLQVGHDVALLKSASCLGYAAPNARLSET